MHLPVSITGNFDNRSLENIFWWLVFAIVLFSAALANIFASWHYTLLIMVAFPLAIALVMQPQLGTYLLAFFVPVTTASAYIAIYGKWNFIIGNKPIDMLPLFLPVLILAVLGLTVMRLARIPQAPIKNPVTVPLVLFLFYAALTIFWTDLTQHGVFQFFMLATNIILFILVVGTVQDKASHKKLMWCWVLSIALQCLIAIIAFFLEVAILKYKLTSDATFILSLPGGFLQPSGWPRQPTGLQDFHETALLINLAIPIAIGLHLTESRGARKLFLLILIFLMIAVCIRTESRAGVGSLIIMVMGIFFLIKRLRRFFALVIIFFPAVVILIALGLNATFNYYAKTNFESRLVAMGEKSVDSGNALDPGQSASNSHSRMNLWKRSFAKYISVAVQGLGIGNLKYESQAPHAHSIYFSVLFDFGLIGVGLVLSGLLILVEKYSEALRHQTSSLQIMSIAFLGGFFALGFHGLVDFEYNTTSCWFYAGMAVATFNLTLREFLDTRSQELGSGDDPLKVG